MKAMEALSIQGAQYAVRTWLIRQLSCHVVISSTRSALKSGLSSTTNAQYAGMSSLQMTENMKREKLEKMQETPLALKILVILTL